MSASYRLTYSPDAVEDLREIYYYIGQTLHEPVTARDQVSRIRQAI